METIHIFYSEKEWSPTSSITSLGSIFRAINTRHGSWEVGVAVKVSWSFDTYLAWFQILDSRFYHSRLAYITAKIKNSKSVTGRIWDHRFWIRIWDPIDHWNEIRSMSVQSVRRKTKTKTRFRFCFLHLFRPIGKENIVKNKNAFLFLIFISPSNRSNKNQIRENMPGMLLYL